MKKTAVFFRRLSFPAFSFRRLPFSASFFFGVFPFRTSFFSDWGVFGCLWMPAGTHHNRISIKMDPNRAPASQPDQLFVFFLACRLFISDVFFRRLFFPPYFSGVFLSRRLFSASFGCLFFRIVEFPDVFGGPLETVITGFPLKWIQNGLRPASQTSFSSFSRPAVF